MFSKEKNLRCYKYYSSLGEIIIANHVINRNIDDCFKMDLLSAINKSHFLKMRLHFYVNKRLKDKIIRLQ